MRSRVTRSTMRRNLQHKQASIRNFQSKYYIDTALSTAYYRAELLQGCTMQRNARQTTSYRCSVSWSTRLVVAITAILMSIAAPRSAEAGSTPCPLTHTFNYTMTTSYSNGSQFYIGSIQFTFGTGDFDEYAASVLASEGPYYFGDILSSTHQFVLRSSAEKCVNRFRAFGDLTPPASGLRA
jgi:hypothetical protein